MHPFLFKRVDQHTKTFILKKVRAINKINSKDKLN